MECGQSADRSRARILFWQERKTVSEFNMKEKETTRVQIELPPASMERLKELKEKTEAASYAEVTKNAFKLYERMIGLVEEGNSFMIRDKSGKVKDIELLY